MPICNFMIDSLNPLRDVLRQYAAAQPFAVEVGGLRYQGDAELDRAWDGTLVLRIHGAGTPGSDDDFASVAPSPLTMATPKPPAAKADEVTGDGAAT